jgi:His/Glu/Gln/Arg/opine family amino acid ABC transporter permease subunit
MIDVDLPDWASPVARYMLHTGVPGTLRIAVFAVAGSLVVGLVLGILLTLRTWPVRSAVRLYIEVWRGLPIIVTIFLIYFALPTLHVKFDAFTAASVGLTLWGSAQIAEATRGAIQSVPREQHEAASALGFGWVGTQVYVIFPQASRRLLPPLVSLLANVIQNTTLAALIGVAEVLQSGQRSVERLQLTPPGDSHAFEIYGAVLVVFFAISFPLTRLAALLEKRLAG